MSKLVSFVFCLVCVVAVSAQGKPGSAWQTFTSSEGRFQMSLPGVPQESSREMNTIGGKAVEYRFVAETRNVAVALMYCDYPQFTTEMDEDQRRQIYDTLSGKMSGSAPITGLTERDTQYGGLLGRELIYQTPGGKTMRHWMMLRGKRLYQMAIGYLTARAGDPLVKGEADRLLDSFRLTGQLGTPPVWQELTSTEGGFRAEFPGTPQQSMRDDEGINGKTNNYLYEVEIPDRFFRLTYANYRDSTEAISAEEQRRIYDETSVTFKKKPGVKMIFGERETRNDGILGRELTIVTDGGVSLRHRSISRGSRIYRLLVGYLTTQQDNPEVQQQIDHFMNSFRLTDQPANQPTVTAN